MKDALEQIGADLKANLANLSGDIDRLQAQITELEQKVKDSQVIGGLSMEDAEDIKALFSAIRDTTKTIADRVPEPAAPGEDDSEPTQA